MTRMSLYNLHYTSLKCFINVSVNLPQSLFVYLFLSLLWHAAVLLFLTVVFPEKKQKRHEMKRNSSKKVWNMRLQFCPLDQSVLLPPFSSAQSGHQLKSVIPGSPSPFFFGEYPEMEMFQDVSRQQGNTVYFKNNDTWFGLGIKNWNRLGIRIKKESDRYRKKQESDS